MEKETPGATSGAAGNPPTAQPAAAPAAPSTPAALPTFRPADARHMISTIQRPSGRSSGSQEELRLPGSSLGSPLARKSERVPENDEGGTAAKNQGAAGMTPVAGGGRGPRGGEGVQGNDDDDPDSESEFPQVQQVLYRASDMMPSSPAGPPQATVHKQQTAGGAHGAEDKGKTTAGSKQASALAAPRPGDNSSTAGGEPNDEEEADKKPSPLAPKQPSKKARLGTRAAAASVGQLSNTSGHTDNNTPLEKSGGASVNTSNHGSELASKTPCARKRGATAAGPSGAASANQKREPRADGPGITTAYTSNESREHPQVPSGDEEPSADQEPSVEQLIAASVGPAFPAGPPFGSIESLFPNVPLCFDAGADTGRLWYPLSFRGAWDPHWEAWPRNLNNPLVPGEGTCHPSDLTDPDSALPDLIHEYNLAQAREGTLFSSTIETLNWVTTAFLNAVNAAPQPPQPPPQKQQRLPARPFRFPRSGMDPFVGARLPAAWSRINDLVNASQEPNPLAEGVDVPPALPRTICDGTEFCRDGDNSALRVSREWWESGLVVPVPTRTPEAGAAGLHVGDDGGRPGIN